MLQLIAVLAVGLALVVAANWFGADSRDGMDWRPATRDDCAPRCN